MSIPTADGMYAMTLDPDLTTRVLGGPFNDIDDVLDACFDELMSTDRARDTVFYVEVLGGRVAVRAFPHGAFPFEDDLAECR